MKAKLNIVQRIALSGCLPQAGNFLTLKILRKLKETLSPSEHEFASLKIRRHYQCPYRWVDEKTGLNRCDNAGFYPEPVMCAVHNVQMEDTGTFQYDRGMALNTVKEITLGDEACRIVVASLKKLDAENRLTDDHLSLWEMFIGFGDEEEETASN